MNENATPTRTKYADLLAKAGAMLDEDFADAAEIEDKLLIRLVNAEAELQRLAAKVDAPAPGTPGSPTPTPEPGGPSLDVSAVPAEIFRGAKVVVKLQNIPADWPVLAAWWERGNADNDVQPIVTRYSDHIAITSDDVTFGDARLRVWALGRDGQTGLDHELPVLVHQSAPADPDPGDTGDALPADSSLAALRPWLPRDHERVTSTALAGRLKSGTAEQPTVIKTLVVEAQPASWYTLVLRNLNHVVIEDLVIIGRPFNAQTKGGGGIEMTNCRHVTVRNVRYLSPPIGPSHAERAAGMFVWNCEDCHVEGFAQIGGGDALLDETHEGFYSHCIYYLQCKRCTFLNVAAIDGHGNVIKASADEAGGSTGNLLAGLFGWGMAFLVAFSWTNNRAARAANQNTTLRHGRLCRADGEFAQTADDGIRCVWTHNTDRSVLVDDCDLYDTDVPDNFPGVVAGDGVVTDMGTSEDRRDQVYLAERDLPALRAELVRHGFGRPDRLPACLREVAP